MARKALTMSERRGDVGVVRFLTSQVLDEMNVQQLGEELRYMVDKQYLVKIVINFERVKFLSSAVLGKLIALHKRLAKEKGRLALCSINTNVRQVFKITRLDKLIPIFDSEEEAITKIMGPKWS